MENLYTFIFSQILITISSKFFFPDFNIRRDPTGEEAKGRDCSLLKNCVKDFSAG